MAAVLLFVLATAVWGGLIALRDIRMQDRFDFLRWEMQSLPNRWLWAVGTPFRDDPPAEEALTRYFSLRDRGSGEGRRLENLVESVIESRIAEVMRDEGLGWPFPVLLPPVDMEIAASPRVLVVSPRSRIARERTETLRPDFSPAAAEALETRVEQDGEWSALVVPTGGVATYPAIVSIESSYAETVAAAAHEWMHHYLSLYPLGRAYFSSGDARTINETVADIAGDEIGRSVIELWGIPESEGVREPPETIATPSPERLDVTLALRDLRMEVDSLLANGGIDAAERRMEAVQRTLWDAGYPIRRINQAYFAWYGTYAARPDAVDPLGGQIRALRERSDSLRQFIATMRELRTRADVQRLVRE